MKHEGNWKINNYYYSVSGSGCVGHCTSLLQDPARRICSHAGSDAMREGKEETGKLRHRIVPEVDGAAELLHPHSPRALAGSMSVPAPGSISAAVQEAQGQCSGVWS